ncbi:putative LysR family transcriptional regulator [Gordonia hirsuta DSM 44140 = NBRC 16056]|uniref:Putative LysR family transcriptional regulator n=1 Tax=Gordonia hirsuta DSM 44140 = NBRC 16056 TaxID=1121927 RepID=L7LB16_9ACTN|nr:LysR family transcriptional regulator [Gordonia hirsuta]GAC57931.1 putative LysR family transcriptional regulator [Gordonia hirsuta DSM 44140 = NBRC 16056]
MTRPPAEARDVRADDLRYLLAVARTGSRTVAAADLGVDASTVTRRVRALEQALGVRLVEQGAQSWELTESGRLVAATATPIETAVEHALDVVAGAEEESLRGNVRVSAPDAFGAYFVAPALVRLRQRHPHLTVELLTVTRQLNLHQSGFDVVIAVGNPASSRLVSETLTEYTLGLYATEEYLAEYGELTSLADLKRHPLIWYVDSLLQVGDLDLDKHLPQNPAKLMSTSVFAQVEAVSAGGGIGLLPAFVAGRHPRLRRLLPDQVDVRLQFCLAARREGLSSAAVQAIRSAVHEELRGRIGELLPDAADGLSRREV